MSAPHSNQDAEYGPIGEPTGPEPARWIPEVVPRLAEQFHEDRDAPSAQKGVTHNGER